MRKAEVAQRQWNDYVDGVHDSKMAQIRASPTRYAAPVVGVRSLNREARKRELERINAENIAFAQRLEAVKAKHTVYWQWQRDAIEQESLLRRMRPGYSPANRKTGPEPKADVATGVGSSGSLRRSKIEPLPTIDSHNSHVLSPHNTAPDPGMPLHANHHSQIVNGGHESQTLSSPAPVPSSTKNLKASSHSSTRPTHELGGSRNVTVELSTHPTTYDITQQATNFETYTTSTQPENPNVLADIGQQQTQADNPQVVDYSTQQTGEYNTSVHNTIGAPPQMASEKYNSVLDTSVQVRAYSTENSSVLVNEEATIVSHETSNENMPLGTAQLSDIRPKKIKAKDPTSTSQENNDEDFDVDEMDFSLLEDH
ncbi:hypothetical protein Pelo_1758 [Pelomyxa schiedti]|nr:hypothetical protein Pelo_1758 [Pelomyxa schiedti]